MYGQPPAPVDEEVRRKVIGDEKPVTDRPADHIEPGLEQARKESANYAESVEDVLSYALFPQVAMKFLQERLAARSKVDYNIVEGAKKDHPAGYYPA